MTNVRPFTSAMSISRSTPAVNSVESANQVVPVHTHAVGEPTIEQGLDKALTKASKVVKRTVEATTDEITSELQEALKS